MPLISAVRMEAVRRLLRDETDPELTLEEHDGESLTVYAKSAGMTQRFLFTKI